MKINNVNASIIRDTLKNVDANNLFASKIDVLHHTLTPNVFTDNAVSVDSDDVEKIPQKKKYRSLNVGYSPVHPIGTTPLFYEFNNDDNVYVITDCEFDPHPNWSLLPNLGLKIAPDVSLLFNKNGSLQMAHTGTGSLFDLLMKFDDPKFDHCIIRFGDSKIRKKDLDEDEVLLQAHIASGAKITAVLLEESKKFSDTKPILVQNENCGVCLCDQRDITLQSTNETLLFEAGTYVISRSVFASFERSRWEFRRRRYHANNKVWYQVEHDLCQLTKMFETNYVKL